MPLSIESWQFGKRNQNSVIQEHNYFVAFIYRRPQVLLARKYLMSSINAILYKKLLTNTGLHVFCPN
jgi:hypothetical protein